ncbi:glycosyltransferase family 39 protein [Arenibacter aquaticus]|uniref:Glycosyltransferase family 39 protein n=1 Tax=Arenibacter aquaticus TaxID=2489054 RepID=A0A3S0AC66_9FLAO|nr:glycosyltransferase family 39 protein [Arenibacter aquaticus]RTE52130.1 glycosyltransferase family 39 protein [Arenibacter aquaticus]
MLSGITSIRYYFLFLAIALFVLLVNLGSYGLAETSEARYAEISREMLQSGDYINPELLGVFHYHKPPLTYYITILGYRIFGINEFGARFFLQIALLVELLLVYGIAMLLYNNSKIAFTSGLIYFSMPIVLISSRNLTTDAYLTAFILGAVYCWQYYTSKYRIWSLYLFYLLSAMAFLTKGPVALLFIFTYIIVYKVIYNMGSKINIHHLLGICLFLVIGGSWYFVVTVNTPGLWDYFLGEQIVERITLNTFNRSKPFWFYLPLVIGLLVPWWLMFYKRSFKISGIWAKLSKQDRVLLASTLCTFLFFSVFKSKLILYILPIFWMLAVLIGSQLFRASYVTCKLLSLAYSILMGVLIISIVGLSLIYPSLFQIGLGTWLLSFSCFIVFGTLFFLIKNNSSYKPALLAGCFGASLILIVTSLMSHNSGTINSTKDIVTFINGTGPIKHKTILVYDYLLSSIPFYSDADLITLKCNHNTTSREVQFQKDKEWVEGLWDVNNSAVLYRLDSLSHHKNTFLLIRKKRDLDDSLNYLRNNFNSSKDYPKWLLLYNK